MKKSGKAAYLTETQDAKATQETVSREKPQQHATFLKKPPIAASAPSLNKEPKD